MKVIFLDIDGVLNSADTMAEGIHLDPAKVIILREIVDQTNAMIVISSTWRFQYSIKEMGDLLYRTGFRGAHRVIDSTPKSKDGHRGSEIETWLNDRNDVEKYVIIDDSSDFFDYQKKNFVQTKWETGLNWIFANKAIEILNEK